jgi:hypothetical protein
LIDVAQDQEDIADCHELDDAGVEIIGKGSIKE